MAKLILITGVSGFVATHIVKSFLERGYHVRGTVRSEESANNVRTTFSQYGDQLSFVIVPDISVSGAFDDAVLGVDGIIHTASPFQLKVDDNETGLLIPAINGTKSILRSAKAHAPLVHRIIITSSFAAVINSHEGLWPTHIYTEADWNPVTYEKAMTSDGLTAYCASKKLAEEAAFEFVAAEKPQFSISTICPPMVYGPVFQHVASLSKLNTSAKDIYRFINGSTSEIPETYFAWVDVRDVAEAHLRAFESTRAAGQRFLVSAGNFNYQQICEILRAEIPEIRGKVPTGQAGASLPDGYKVSSAKAESVLGIKFRSLSESIRDTAMSLLALEKRLGHSN